MSRLAYLSRHQARTLAALAEVLVPDAGAPPVDVARNVDRYMAAFRARRKWLVKVALVALELYPLLSLKPPLSRMAPADRVAFLRERFVRDVAHRRILIGRELVRAIIRLGQQLTFLGCYGDPRTFPTTGYVPFSRRGRPAEPLPRRPLTTLPHDRTPDTLHADAVVVGSGAAGSVLAHRLAEAGRSVLVLERGRHVDRSAFGEDEISQITALYGDGALQLSRDFSFQVLQGACVGGTTVVNNAVCFDLPADVLAHWNARGAGLDPDRLADAFADVRAWLGVRPQTGSVLSPGAEPFLAGAHALGLSPEIVEANVADCPGTGYCNIGCPVGNKLSMLETVLPEGQRRFGDGLRILADATVERIEASGGVAEGVTATLAEGRSVRVRAGTVVLAAGPIASSWLLMRSRLGGRSVGRGLAFNMGSPITAEFERPIHAYDGLQITHTLRTPDAILETWFNPVVSQALNLPGWFEEHAHTMRRYTHLAAGGALVATGTEGRVRRALTGGPDLVYTPSRHDLERLVQALKLVARIYLAAGALRVMPNTYELHELTDPDQLDVLDRYVRDASDLSVGTGHPQGGNALGAVVGSDFRVKGTRNVFACDASVFPTAIGVNPQLTVMALAQYAAPGIAGQPARAPRAAAPPRTAAATANTAAGEIASAMTPASAVPAAATTSRTETSSPNASVRRSPGATRATDS